MTPTLQDLQDLARGAGEILRAGFHSANHIQHKGEIDLVTEIDHQSETYLLEQISTRFPGHHIIAEETGQKQGDPTTPGTSTRWTAQPTLPTACRSSRFRLPMRIKTR